MAKGVLWAEMDGRPRRQAATLAREDIPTSPGVYAWYRRGKAIYVGKAKSLRDRLWTRHLGKGKALGSSAFRRNVAAQLGIATAVDIKAGRYQPNASELLTIRAFIEECEVAWVKTRTPAAAVKHEDDIKDEWMPPLTKM